MGGGRIDTNASILLSKPAVTTHPEKKPQKANGVITFAPAKRLLQQARAYIDDLELFLADRHRAIPVLLRALKLGDQELKREITSLLGGFAGSDITGHLYRIIMDAAEDGDLRHEAAVQLSVTLPMADDPRPLVDSLLENLNSPDAELRSYAALALGWEGNHRALDALIERLDDPDDFVQQAAVNALANLQTDRAFQLMRQRLTRGRQEQKRSILFALWRFHTRREEVAALYKEQLEVADDALRFEALVLLGRVTDIRDQIPFYRRCLKDRDPRVREKALEILATLAPGDLVGLQPAVEAMLSDPQVRVQQAAMRFLHSIRSTGR